MMKRWFKNFLVGLLGFCVLMGAFCILWPLTHPEEILIPDPQPTQPVETDAPPSEAEPGPEQVVKPEPEPIAEPEPSEPTPEDRRAQAVLRTMSLEEKVYQLFVVTPEALTGVGTATLAGDTTRAALTEKPVGGIVYFAKNLVNAEQAQAMLETTQS